MIADTVKTYIFLIVARQQPSHLYILNFFLQINDVVKKHIINHWYPTRDRLSFLQFCNMVISATHTCVDLSDIGIQRVVGTSLVILLRGSTWLHSTGSPNQGKLNVFQSWRMLLTFLCRIRDTQNMKAHLRVAR
jgi:hypothetical protein